MKNNLIILNDVIFKNMFGREENKVLLSCLLSEIIKHDHEHIYKNMIYVNKDLGKRNIKDSTSIVDILVEVGNIIVIWKHILIWRIIKK